MAHENGFKAIIATQGAEGIALAHRHRIDAITLDIRLPIMDGWRVLDRLKNDLETRHIPVYLITTEEDAARGLSRGAVGALVKPIKEKEALEEVFRTISGTLERREKDLLTFCTEEGEAARLVRSLQAAGVRVRSVSSQAEALGALDERRFDGVVVEAEAGEKDLEDIEVIARQCGSRGIPVFVFTPEPVSEKAEKDLERLSRLATVRRAHAADRLADQIALHLHLPVGNLPEENRAQLSRLYSNSILAGKKVLIVDDDIRNIFAITSVLERQRMVVVPAETGQEAIEKLQTARGIDIVLMDIMMPGMDGYDTMRAIRRLDGLRSLPDHRRDRQGDEGRPGEDAPGGRLGLPRQARGHRPDALGHARMASSVSQEAGAPVNILAVDDSPEKLLALSVLLAELGQNVVTADSGRQALRQLLRREFAVILLDVNMPGLDGFETAALIRQRESCEHTPIIFITSYGDQTHAARGYSLGAVDYILAPLEPEVLKTKVMVFVELFRKTAEVREQARVLERRARQLQRLTEASLAINSALSIDQMLAVVANLSRDILGAHQAVVVAAPDQKWSTPRTAVSLSPEYERSGERTVFRDQMALLSLLSRMRATARVPRGAGLDAGPWQEFLAPGGARGGWLAASLCGRDGHPMGLLHLLDKDEGDFSEEDETILIQLAQMSAIAMENTLNAEALESNRLKDEFLTTLSHELRTPLSAILGWTRTMRSGRLDQERTGHGLEVIERNVVAQTKLIDDLLDVSRIITGKLRLSVRKASLVSVVEAACDSMRPAALAREIEIAIEQRIPEGEETIAGDPDRLQQIFWNLLSNAIKFTPPGGSVTVSLEKPRRAFRSPRPRHRPGYPTGVPWARVRAVPAGRQLDHEVPGGTGDRAGHREAPGRAARRLHCRGEPGRGQRRDLRSPASGVGRQSGFHRVEAKGPFSRVLRRETGAGRSDGGFGARGRG